MGNNEKFDQLMLAENGGLTVEQQQFKDLHERICYNAKKSAEHWVEMAIAIREMRDTKRYKAAGFEEFSEYTDVALGVKERQAYNYISVIEKLPEGFVKAHASIGVTKLALLTSVSESERAEILSKIDIDSAKTSEINAAVKAALDERDKANQQLALALDEKVKVQEYYEASLGEYNALEKKNAHLTSERDAFEAEVKALKARLAEKEKETPAVVYQEDPTQAKKLADAEKEIGKKEKALEEERKVSDAIKKERDEAIKRLAQAEAKTPAKVVEIKGDAIVRFKIRFETFQDVIDDMAALIGEMDAASAEKCKTAVHVVFEDSGI